jgi:hypothetical protein
LDSEEHGTLLLSTDSKNQKELKGKFLLPFFFLYCNMDTLAELWQSGGYKELTNWIDGAIGVSLVMGLYYYKKWVDHKFK